MQLPGGFLWQLLAISLTATTASAPNDGDTQKPIGAGEPSQAPTESRPNIILVLTDDQDLHLDSLSYTPRIKRRLIDEGTVFHRHYCTTAVCCPSRASLWTGKLAHNTNVTDLRPPYGM